MRSAARCAIARTERAPTRNLEAYPHISSERSIPISCEHDILTPLSQAFNSRDIDGALSVMRPDVVWANGMEGGFVYGHEAVREYGTRQWQQNDPRVEPRHFESQGNRLVVDVHQLVRDMNGGVLADQMTKHVFTIDAGVISKCEIA